MTSHEDYVACLVNKFGETVRVLGKFSEKRKPILHECQRCKKPFLVSPFYALRRRHRQLMCSCCSHLMLPEEQSKAEKKFKESLHSKFDFLKVLFYKSNSRMAKFKCTLCGHVWENTPVRVLSVKRGCPNCGTWKNPGKGMLSNDEIRNRLKELEQEVRLCHPYRSVGSDPIWIQFKKCRHKTQITTKQASGQHPIRCTLCHAGRYDRVQLGKRTVLVEGFERFALNYLLRRGVNPDTIEVERGGKVPRFAYTASNVEREYWPDLLVGTKRIVEVKSTYTLRLGWKVCVAKAKAVEASGFIYTMLVAFKSGLVIPLPREWYKHTQDWVEVFIQRKLKTRVTVLALDPGPVNFGWSVIHVDRAHGIKLLACGMIHNRITSMIGDAPGKQILAYTDELRGIIEEFGVDHIAAERFMSRGHGGDTIELVNVMLGATVGLTQEFKVLRRSGHVMLITAAQWKNAWNKYAVLEEFYEETGLTDHTTDSIGIGIYSAQKWLNMEIFADIDAMQDTIVDQLKLLK